MLKAIAQEQVHVTTKQRDGRLNVNRGDSYRNRFADKLRNKCLEEGSCFSKIVRN